MTIDDLIAYLGAFDGRLDVLINTDGIPYEVDAVQLQSDSEGEWIELS